MQYDPVKRRLGRLLGSRPFTRRLFYRLMDVLLLRTWHIHRALHYFAKTLPGDRSVSVLDAGSGFGQYSWYLARAFPTWEVTGIDIKEEEVSACNRFAQQTGRPNLRFFREDLTTYQKKASFDLILSVDVMEHIEEDENVFANFFSSLKPGGLLLISTPSDLGGSDVKHQGDTSFIEEHVRDGYSVQEIRAKLSKAGFETINASYSYGKPGNLSWRLSMKAPIQLLGISKWFLLLLPLYYMLIMPLSLILNVADVKMNHKSGSGLIVKAWKAHNK